MITNTVTIPVDFFHKSANKTVQTVYLSQYDAHSTDICIEAYYDGRNYPCSSEDYVTLSTVDSEGDAVVFSESTSFRDGNKYYFQLDEQESIGEYDIYFSIENTLSRIGVKAFKLVVIPFPVENLNV